MNQVDTDLFYWINSHHTSWLDWVMWIASQGWSWGIVIAAAIIHMVTKADSRRWASLGWIVAGVGLCFLLSDRISVLCFKDVFCRLRPCHALENVRMFRTSCGGLYGFVSSHAANVFSLALFLSLYHAKKASVHPKSSIFTFHLSPFTFHLSLFIWACLVGYSRPYLGKHYPGDVVCGALLGLAVGTVVFFLVQHAEKWVDRFVQQKKFSRQ